MRWLLLGLALACKFTDPPMCVKWGTKHVEAFDETAPRIPLCAVYKCGATTTHHEAHDEPACLGFK